MEPIDNLLITIADKLTEEDLFESNVEEAILEEDIMDFRNNLKEILHGNSANN